jgi:polyhydroxyalkanoate synthesis regulator phasin
MNGQAPEPRRFEEAMAEIDKVIMMRVEEVIAPLRAQIEELKERVDLLEAEDRQDPAT